MHTVHLLCLAALIFCKPITSHPIQKETDLTRENQKDTETTISSYGYFLMTKLSQRIRKAIYEESDGLVLLKKGNKNCISLLDDKTNHTMCSDTTKKPYISSNKHKTLRQKRNQHFDPSDPLGSESRRSRTTNYRRPNHEREHEHSSNASKETISSCDDPLHVLLSKSPASPNLQKEKKKQLAPTDPF